MTISHHPSEALLVAYGAGTLGEGMVLVVAAHLFLCRVCRQRSQFVDAIGGALMEELPPAPLAADAFARVLARAEAATQMAATPAGKSDNTLPAPIRNYLRGELDRLAWRRLVPGIRQVGVPVGGRGVGTVRLLHIGPGTRLPQHSHSGTELTLVLQGAYDDELGRFGRGDFAELDDEIMHRPVADSHTGCMCLIATEAPLRFTGRIARLLQPLIRI